MCGVCIRKGKRKEKQRTHILHLQRFFSGWRYVYTSTPPTLIGTLGARTLDEVLKQVSNCLIKVYTLCECIANAMREKVRNFAGDPKGDDVEASTSAPRERERAWWTLQRIVRGRGIFGSRETYRMYKAKNFLHSTSWRWSHSILQSIDAEDALRDLGDKASRYLPESTVLEFLLNVNAPVLKTVEEHLRMYSDASPSAFWDGKRITRAPR